MRRTAGVFLALALIVVSACGNTPTVPPNASSAAASSNPASASSSAAFAPLQAAIAGLAPRTGIVDIAREQLIANLGLRNSLGADADAILALAAASQDAALGQEPPPPATGRTSDTIVDAAFHPDLPIAPVPPPDNDLREYLAGVAASVGAPGGDASVHQGPDPDHPDTATRQSGGLSGTTVMTTTLDGAIHGSVATVQVGRTAHSVVTDSATKAVVLDETLEYQIIGQIDVCPSVAGVVDASIANTFNGTVSTSAGADGRLASNAASSFTSTSAFQGQVDDQANLGAVSQDYKHEEMYKRTTSSASGSSTTDAGSFGITATGIKDGLPTAHAWSLTLGDWSSATGSPSLTGSATQDMITSTAFSAALDYNSIDQSYLAAQRRWRTSVCVVITAPTYNVESDPGGPALPHVQEVAKGSTSNFQIGLKQRFGAAVAASVTTELTSGGVSLSPDSIEAPPGTMIYVAPDEDGKDATASFTSTSRQGIGLLELVFHTGAKELQVSISGTMTTTALGVSYVTTLNASNIVLKEQPDGLYQGTGPVTTKVTIKGLCPNPFNETGTLTLKSSREAVTDPTLPQSWYVSLDSANVLTTGTCLGQSLGSLIQTGPNGFAGDFMTAVGVIVISSGGGLTNIAQNRTVGAAKQAVTGTAKGVVISESAQ